MFGGSDGLRRMMDREQLKPKNLSETLARFAVYFKPYWLAMVLVAVLIVVSTWTQVVNPDLVGQVVDCYVTPIAASALNFPGAPTAVDSAGNNCWLANDPATLGLGQRVLQGALTIGNFPRPNPTSTSFSTADRLSGLGRMIGLLVALYLAGAVLGGLTFFTMTWAGQHVLRSLRVDVFQHIHRLSLSYYAEHEAGDLMSRITNDAETINQALELRADQRAQRRAAAGVGRLQHAHQEPALCAAEPGGAAGHDHRHLLVLGPGAQSLPQDAPGDGQRQRRAAGEHLGRARGAGLQPRRREYRELPHHQRRQPRCQRARGGLHQRAGADPGGPGLRGPGHRHRRGRPVRAAQPDLRAPRCRWAW